jgi:hypothetical protein
MPLKNSDAGRIERHGLTEAKIEHIKISHLQASKTFELVEGSLAEPWSEFFNSID